MESLIGEGVVAADRTRFIDDEFEALAAIVLTGEIETASGGVLHVRKRLATMTRHRRLHVRTGLYIYHGRAPRHGRLIDVFRFDNSHRGAEALHRHVFDSDGNMIAKEPLALEDLPPLSRIVRDVEFYARYLATPGA